MIIRGHQDNYFNTCFIEKNKDYGKFIDINDKSYFTENNDANTVCYGYSHLIEYDYDLYIDSKKYENLIPVITVSTNTDYGRKLTRDNFNILKFFPDKSNKCASYYSKEHLAIRNEIRTKNGKKPLPFLLTPKHVLSSSSKYAEKYLKYKMKYLNLKNKIQ